MSFLYEYNFDRNGMGSYNCPYEEVIDTNIKTSSYSDEIQGSGFKATSFSFKSNNFITSSTDDARHYYFNLQVYVNGSWKIIYQHDEDDGGGWWFPAKTEARDFNVSDDISADVGALIGQYGISDFRIQNLGGWDRYAEEQTDDTIGWTLRGKSTGTGTISFNVEKNITPITAPNSVTATPSSTPPNSNVKIEWKNHKDGTNNKISGFDLLVVNSKTLDQWWYSEKYNDDARISSSTTSVNISFDSVGTYTVIAYAYDQEGTPAINDQATVNITVANITNPDKPKNLKVNSVTDTLYIGRNNSPAISFQWGNPDNYGVLNGFLEYWLYKGNTPVKKQITTNSVPNFYAANAAVTDKVGTYKVVTRGKVEGTYSEDSNLVKVALITDPVTPTIDSLPTTINEDFLLKWASTATSKDYSVAYKLEYTIGEDTTKHLLGDALTTNTYNFPISNISAGQKFKFIVTTTLTATGGGTSTAQYTSQEVLRADGISFSNPWIKVTNELDKQNFPLYAYNKITLAWNKATSNTPTTFTYTIMYSLDGGSSWSSINVGSNTSYTIDLLNTDIVIKEGTKIIFEIIARDGFGQEVKSIQKSITRMSKPTIDKLEVTAITKDGFSYKYNYSFKASGEKLKITYYLGYGGNYDDTVIESINDLTTLNGTINSSINNLVSVLSSGSSSTASTMRKNLYKKVITNKYAQPEGCLKVRVASAEISACYTEAEVTFKYYFATTASFASNALTIKQPSGRSYYNEGEQIQLKFSKLGWTDAAGGTSGADIEYTISGNNKNFPNVTPSTSYNINDIAPKTDSDINLLYTLSAKIKYSDLTLLVNEVSSSITIARWTDIDSIYLSQVNKEGQDVEGIIVLPSGLCSSTLGNLNKKGCYYDLYYESGDPIDIEVPISEAEINNKKISFNFTDSSDANISIYAKVYFVNNTEGVRTIVETSPVYLIRTSDVPVAIRKGRVGINVDSASFMVSSSAGNNSALYVTGANETATVMELNAINNGYKFINFLVNGSIFASMTKGSNYLYFSQGLRSLSHMGIYGSTNDSGEETNPSLYFVKYNSGGQVLGYIAANRNDGHIGFAQRAITEGAAYEYYYLPTTSSAGGSYNILTTKNAVTIAQGGTGATTAANARHNLTNLGANVITTTTNDTVAKWGAYKGLGFSMYSAAGQLNDQPTQYGLLLNIGHTTSEVHQLWMTQASGPIYHRGGNASGWSGTWRTLLDNINYSDYALPKSGGTLTGELTLKSNLYSDSLTAGALHLSNSNIDGVNGIYFSDQANAAGEGIHFYRSATTTDTIFSEDGILYYAPNRTIGEKDNHSEIIYRAGYSKSIPISDGTNTDWLDLNNYKAPDHQGVYYCPLNNTVKTLKNCPTTYAFTLTILRHAGTQQILTEYMAGNTSKTYFRNFYSNTWSEWKLVYNGNTLYYGTSAPSSPAIGQIWLKPKG